MPEEMLQQEVAPEMNYPEMEDTSTELPHEIEVDDPILHAIQHDLILVHMSEQEADELDYMQGGTMIHPETELRMYPRLALMMKDEKFRSFMEQLGDQIINSGHADHAIQNTYKNLPKEREVSPGFTMAPGDFSSEGIKLGADGEQVDKDDDITVHIPLEFADMMDKVRGATVRNPTDDLRQYGKNWFKRFLSKPLSSIAEIPQIVTRETVRGVSDVTGIKRTHLNEFIRVGSTIGGYMLGGPLGAGLGTTAGNYLTGANIGKSLGRGVKVGAGAYGAELLAGGMGNMFGATQAGSNVPTFVNGVQQASTAAGAGGAGAGMNAATNAAAQGASGGLGIGDIFKYGLPLASAGMMFMGHKKEKAEEERLKREHQESLTRFRKQHGMDESLYPLVYEPTEYNPQEGDFSYGKERLFYQPTRKYAKGGHVNHRMDLLPGEEVLHSSKLIQGEGKGQDDKIPVNVPEGTFIWDSHSVSQLGDGSTRAGAAILDALSARAAENAHRLGGKVKLSNNRVPTMLSDGEYAMHPLAVAGVGNGSNKIGSKNIDMARKSLRKKKVSRGTGLPPMAGNILDHFPKPIKSTLSRVA